jgi:diacylglycerol O-acyltransferase / wax synthase
MSMAAAGPPGLAWGLEREMNALEAVMWRAEADARLRSTVTGLEILETVPDWDRYVAAHDWATRMVPRFRQHVVQPVFGLGQPTWIVDPDFDLTYHVRRQRLVEPTYACLLEAVQTLAMTPFDKARAPWETVLFEGLPGGRAAFALKLHHSTTDGLGAVELLRGLHSRTFEPTPDKPQPQAPVPEMPSPSRELARQAARDLAGAARLGRGLVGSLAAVRHPNRALRDAVEFAASLQRVLGDPPAAPSPLLRRRSMSWRFHALDVMYMDMRAASKPHGCSLNDAFVAALLGAFRLYHEQQGCPVEAIPMAIPISVRKEGDSAGGNRIAGARLAGPVSIADPLARMKRVREVIRSTRAEPAMDALGALAPALARLPGPLIAQIAGGATKGSDLQASNVPGIREDVYLAGTRIERTYPFGPLPGCAAMIALVSHGPYCCVGANIDAAAFTDVEGFGRCLEQGFNEVLSLHPGAAAAVRRV